MLNTTVGPQHCTPSARKELACGGFFIFCGLLHALHTLAADTKEDVVEPFGSQHCLEIREVIPPGKHKNNDNPPPPPNPKEIDFGNGQ